MKRRFAPSGYLALAPRAYGSPYDLIDKAMLEAKASNDGVAVVDVRGPLEHHESWFYDSYDEIKERVACALKTSPKALVLAIDSPGGLVSGCFEAARDIRRMAKDAKVPLHAFVDGQATSAAYALACAADRIAMSATAAVGSIGIIDALLDVTAMDEKMGLRVALVTSGARKADGNPHGGISEDAIAASQKCVDELAESFFAWVSESRGVAAEKIRALEAGILLGPEAIAQGLADELCTLDEMIASISKGSAVAVGMTGRKSTMKLKDAIAALRKAAEGEGEEAELAKRMLAAEAEGGDADSSDGEKAADDGDEKDDAEDEVKPSEDEVEPAKKEDEKDDDEEGSKAIKPSTLTALATQVAAMKAEREREKMAALLASRPDVDDAMKAVVRKMKYAEAKNVLDAIAKPAKPKTAKPAASAVVTGTRGQSQSGHGAATTLGDIEAARERLYGPKAPTGIRMERNTLVLGALTPEEAKAFLDQKEAAAKAAKGATR